MRRGLVLSGFLFPIFYFPAALLPAAPLSTTAVAILFAASIFVMGLGFGVTDILFNTAFVPCVDRIFMARISGITNALLPAMMPVVVLLCSGLSLFLPVIAIFSFPAC